MPSLRKKRPAKGTKRAAAKPEPKPKSKRPVRQKKAARAKSRPKRTRASAIAAAEWQLARRIGLPREARILEPIERDLDKLSLVIEAEPGATAARLRQHLERVYESVVLARLFPQYSEGEDIPSLRNYYVATLPDLPVSRLLANPHDIGYAALQKGLVASVQPDLPTTVVGGLCKDAHAEEHTDKRWSLTQMRVQDAWQKLTDVGINRGGGISIGHLDNGITNHELLFRQTSPIAGFDLLRGTAPGVDPLPPVDSSHAEFKAHGTQTCSIIAADPGNNGASMSGIAPDCAILPFRVTRSVLALPPSLLARGIAAAIAAGSSILSISLGGATNYGVWAAIRNAYARNLLICCAAGQCEPVVVCPALFPESIAVGGSCLRTEPTGVIHEFPWTRSAMGKVDIAASAENAWNCFPEHVLPGGGSFTGPFSGDAQSQGTSFAAPAVAAIGALWLSFHASKGITLSSRYTRFMALNRVFKRILRESARRPTAWPHHGWGPGIVDARAVLDAPLPPAGLQMPPLPFLAQFDQPDHFALFEGIFWEQPAAAVRAVLGRMLGAANPEQLRNSLHQYGGELTGLLQGTQEHFDQVRDAVAAEAQGQADRAAAAARHLAENASERLRSVLR
jgi:hypothetical protein